MKSAISVLAAVLAFSASAGIPTDGLGYRITRCQYDIFGVNVSFETTNPPPYVVGIFLAEEVGFGTRIFPLRVKLVHDRVAYLSGSFYERGNAFVQVLSPSVTNDPMFRVLGETDQQRYFDDLRRKIDRSSVIPDPDDIWDERISAPDMQLISDYTWGTFYPTTNGTLTVRGRGRKAVVDVPGLDPGYVLLRDSDGHEFPMAERRDKRLHGELESYVVSPVPEAMHYGDVIAWRERTGTGTWDFVEHTGLRCAYNPRFPKEAGNHEWKFVPVESSEQTLGPFDTSVGCGLRVIYREREDVFTAKRAYSLFSDRSNEVVLRRPLRPLSAHDGKKIVLDWMGLVRMATETNAVPDRIYWEGL